MRQWRSRGVSRTFHRSPSATRSATSMPPKQETFRPFSTWKPSTRHAVPKPKTIVRRSRPSPKSEGPCSTAGNSKFIETGRPRPGWAASRPPSKRGQRGGEPLCSARTLPFQPVDHALPHDQIEISALQPREFLGEHRHTLAVGARHARDIRSPKEPIRPESIVDLMQTVVN